MYLLKNKNGLFLMSLSPIRDDYGFTTNRQMALQFKDLDEAEGKCNHLKRFGLSIENLNPPEGGGNYDEIV